MISRRIRVWKLVFFILQLYSLWVAKRTSWRTPLNSEWTSKLISMAVALSSHSLSPASITVRRSTRVLEFAPSYRSWFHVFFFCSKLTDVLWPKFTTKTKNLRSSMDFRKKAVSSKTSFTKPIWIRSKPCWIDRETVGRVFDTIVSIRSCLIHHVSSFRILNIIVVEYGNLASP